MRSIQGWEGNAVDEGTGHFWMGGNSQQNHTLSKKILMREYCASMKMDSRNPPKERDTKRGLVGGVYANPGFSGVKLNNKLVHYVIITVEHLHADALPGRSRVTLTTAPRNSSPEQEEISGERSREQVHRRRVHLAGNLEQALQTVRVWAGDKPMELRS
ncbi:hypothetical protein SKAU_G00148890 [Synaphobranchus kaupii]|uniref:Uncharacterized protein n=1 Tax=Synaphobranchus kaupii TaxID=118154 RepID=A0A9Q1FU08_SYNKA|nr:hypothetical protein SKAU_G00148890 [Synaphobranchus kaupii]